MNYDSLEKQICTWARKRDDVLALVVIGSRARQDHPADEWSDLDLMLFVTDPQVYAADGTWISQFGEIWLQTHKITGLGDPEWLVLFAGGLKVDFLLVSGADNHNETLFGTKYLFVTRRGVRVLLDKQRGFEREDFQAPSLEWQKPDEAAFTAVLNQFWLSSYRAANIIQRGELWRAKMIIDAELRRLLLCLLEWHAKAVNGGAYDTWHDGRFLVEWADPQTLAVLPEIFAPFNKARTSHALLRMMELMNKLGKEVADQWCYHYPATATKHVRDWIAAAI